MLPNMPDEVFEMFIVPLNEHPASIFDDKPEGRWFYHFGGLSIEEFSELRWKRATLFFNKDRFHPLSCQDIDTLLEFCELPANSNRNTLYQGYSPSSREHLARLNLSILNTGKLNAPIVCIKTRNGYRVLDGCHRLAAAFSLDIRDSIPLDAWVGE